MNLSDVAPTGRCRIVSTAEDNREFQSRLYALGLYPGVEVDVLHVAPFGDPLQVRVGHTLLSIRRQEAMLVSVATEAVALTDADVMSDSKARAVYE